MRMDQQQEFIKIINNIMKKILLTLCFLWTITTIYAQDQNGYYIHTFKIENITTYREAKSVIVDIRKSTGERIFYFDDSTSVFTLKTKQIYAANEFFDLLLAHNFNVIH